MTNLSEAEEDNVRVWEVDLVTWPDGTRLIRVLFEEDEGLPGYVLRSHDGIALAALDLEEQTFQSRPFQGKQSSQYMNITLFTQEGEEGEGPRRSRLSDLPFRRARGLLVSALCEVLFQGRAPDLRWPALHAFPLMLLPLTMKTLEEGLKLLFEPGARGLFDPREAHQKITMVLPSVGLPKLTRVNADYRALESHEVISCAWSEPDVRYAGPSASNERYEGPSVSTHMCERVQIWLPTHGDTISLEPMRFVLEGLFTGPVPAWSVRWVATDPDPEKPFERVVAKDEMLAEGCATPLRALEKAGLVRLDSPEVQQAWIDEALTSWPEPTWTPGLQDAIAPGRLMGSDPLFIQGDADFLAWVRAAGLEHLARRADEGPPVQIHLATT